MKNTTTYKHWTFVSMIMFTSIFYAQQDPQFTQYMYNMSVINPAYATDEQDKINLGGLYRAQWVGSVGGPETGTFFVHAPLSKKVEMGLSVVNDRIGDVVNETNLFVDFAYVVHFSKSKLSFGLKGGLTFFDTDFNNFQLIDANPDPAFADNISKVFPNIGTGVFYFSDNYYLGVSAPNLLQTNHLERTDGIYTTGSEEMHYFITGGYVFDLSPKLKFKPAFMAKTANGSPLSIDITANFLINDVFEIGGAYRLDDSFSGMVNFRVLKDIRIGYAYDHTVSNLGRFNSGSHEIVLLFDIYKKKKKAKIYGYDKSPRFF